MLLIRTVIIIVKIAINEHLHLDLVKSWYDSQEIRIRDQTFSLIRGLDEKANSNENKEKEARKK